MSDATLPPPRCSSAGPAAGDGNRSDSSSGEVESDASLIQSSDAASKEERSGNPEGRIENKQKRKRTRYVVYLWGTCPYRPFPPRYSLYSSAFLNTS